MLRRQIGMFAGVLLIIVILAAVTPPLVVQYRLHSFLGKLHAGMSRDEVSSAARSAGLAAGTQGGTTLDFDDPAPWSVGAQCRDDYAVIVVMKDDRAKSWAKIKNHLCT